MKLSLASLASRKLSSTYVHQRWCTRRGHSGECSPVFFEIFDALSRWYVVILLAPASYDLWTVYNPWTVDVASFAKLSDVKKVVEKRHHNAVLVRDTQSHQWCGTVVWITFENSLEST